ncbi:MAG: glycosyltransferase [Cyclobacteriaceae bacterium]
MPTISVIIPTYNRAHLIKETIKSVLRQTFSDYELIVVDDGSTDNTEKLISNYPDIRYIKISNSGQSIASNIGIHASESEYIALLDSDDLWDDHFLSTSYTVLKENKSYDFSYCNYSYFTSDGLISEKYLPKNKQLSGRFFLEVLKGTFICTGSYLIKKEHITKIGLFDETLTVASDFDIWLRISHEYTGIYIDQSLFKLRQHSQRISGNSLIMAQFNLKVYNKIRFLFPDEFKNHKSIIMNKKAENHRSIARNYRKKNQLGLSVLHYVNAANYYIRSMYNY